MQEQTGSELMIRIVDLAGCILLDWSICICSENDYSDIYNTSESICQCQSVTAVLCTVLCVAMAGFLASGDSWRFKGIKDRERQEKERRKTADTQ